MTAADIHLAGPGSVTERDDVPPNALGGVWRWMLVDSGHGRGAQGLPPHWSMARDAVLAATPFLADFWASALRTAVNQIIVRQFTVKDSEDSARRLERSQDLLLDFGGPAMYSESLARVAQDFFLTGNGGFVEIEHEGRTRTGMPTGRPVGLHHLDSLRCWRTGSRAYPVIYVDLWGQYHQLHATSVFSIVDQPSPRLGLWGVGRSAADDNWRTILLAGALEQYLLEKVSGSRALALHFVTGVSRQRLEDAAATGDEEQARKGHIIYKGAAIIPVMEQARVATVDLAGIPDGFDAAELRQLIALNTALALGMPYTDIATLQGGQFGTGTQSQVIDESRKGRGVEAFVRIFERKINRLVLPKRTTVDMFGIDVRDQKAEAEVKSAEAGYVKALIEAGVSSPQQAGNYLADAGHWPAEFVQQDATTGGVLTDSGQDSKISGEAAPEQQPAASPLQPLARLLMAGKARRGRVARVTAEDLAEPQLLAAAQILREEAAA